MRSRGQTRLGLDFTEPGSYPWIAVSATPTQLRGPRQHFVRCIRYWLHLFYRPFTLERTVAQLRGRGVIPEGYAGQVPYGHAAWTVVGDMRPHATRTYCAAGSNGTRASGNGLGSTSR